MSRKVLCALLMAFCLLTVWAQPATPRMPDLASRWLQYRGKVWGGEIGSLALKNEARAALEGQQWMWEVWWVPTGSQASTPSEALVDFADDPYAEDVVAVFALRGQWALVRGVKKHGWGWIRLDSITMDFSPKEEQLRWQEAGPDGSLAGSYLQLEDGAGPLRSRPSAQSTTSVDLADKSWRVCPNHRGYGWTERGSWIRVLEQRGDWIRVMLPKLEHVTPGCSADSYGLSIDWDDKKIGWVKWKRPGPVQGTWESQVKWIQVGIID